MHKQVAPIKVVAVVVVLRTQCHGVMLQLEDQDISTLNIKTI
jgi:hypothetical protein